MSKYIISLEQYNNSQKFYGLLDGGNFYFL